MRSYRKLISKNYLILLIIPILLFIVLGVLQRYLFPLNSGPIGYDPAYAYLFNGLLILNGDIPQHIDHSGTAHISV